MNVLKPPFAQLRHRAASLVRLRLQPALRCQLAQPSPLALVLLAAIALHLLLLSGLQLRQRRQLQAQAPPLRDDTPELLRFSRQQTQEPSLAPLSVGSLSQLPPPPPLGPQATSTSQATTRRVGPSAAVARSQAGAPARRRGAMPSSAKGRPTAMASRRPSAGSSTVPTLEGAVQALRDLQDGRNGQPPAPGESLWPAPTPLQADDLTAWSQLWEKAAAVDASSARLRLLPAGAELRRLRSGDGGGLPLPEPRRLSLRLGERLLLVWPEGEEIWLLQAPTSPPGEKGTPEER